MSAGMRENTDNHPLAGEIDLLEIAKKLWTRRRFVFKWIGIAAVVGLIVGFSIPSEYTVSVKMVAETTEGKTSTSGVSQLASLAGINLGGPGSGYGIGVLMYPQVASSLPFLADMRTVPVQTRKAKEPYTLYDYLSEHQKMAWWNHVIAFPFRALGWFVSLFSDNQQEGTETFDVSNLTKEQYDYVKMMRERMGISLDEKTGIITASVTMQDPGVAAVVADSMVSKFQEYIVRYRTDKARQDMEYCQKAFDESKKQYYEAQNRYAAFVDQNKDLVRQSVKTEQYRLSNEMELAYNMYAATSQQLEMAKLKLQEQTPCLTVIEPATRPLKKSKPSKAKILIGFMFLGALASCGYLVVKDMFEGENKYGRKNELYKWKKQKTRSQ